MKIASLHRYPVKGLSPEPLGSAEIRRGEYFPGDRLFAIENGPSGFDPAAPQHQPKIKFLMLMRHERLARLRTTFDDARNILTIRGGDRTVVAADLGSPDGRMEVEAFFRRYMPEALRGDPKLLEATSGFRFTDSRSGFVSIINQASVDAIGAMLGRQIDPLRFRGNILVSGLGAWREFDLVGRTLSLPSGARLRATKRIVRCAATDVDPTTGERDLKLPAMLQRHLGHADCGIYCEIVGSGGVSVGDKIAVEPPAQSDLPLAAPLSA